jgi:glycosyltransferase involved in cell wall biosynthesis
MKNGLLVKPGDIADFAKKLKVLYENPDLRAKLGRNARETIIKERSWDTRIKKELEVYEKVLSEKNEK